MLDILLPIVLFAVLVYTLYQAPRYISRRPHAHRPSQLGEAGWTFEIGSKSLSIYTKAFNDVPRIIVERLPAALQRSYDLGSIAGVGGTVVSIGGGLWAVKEVWAAVWAEAKIHAAQKVATDGTEIQEGIQKRVLDYLAEGVPGEVSLSGGLQPLIPGVTLPFSHLFTLIVVLVVNQLIHEAGHAFAAAFDDISPSRLSFNLHIIIPSMIVSFPKAVDSLPPKAKLRLATSGPWHNLLTFLFISSLALSGVSRMFWKDISDLGRVIESVNLQSPLYRHLRPGMMITHLDDIYVGGSDDMWQEYLQGGHIGDAGRGWCISKTVYEDLPQPPCAGFHEIVFQPTLKPSPEAERCLAPHPMLDVPSGPCPCPSSKWTCVRPAPFEAILRIQLDSGRRNRQNVVLWSGDRRAVLENVTVGTQTPRFAAALVRWNSLFLYYLSTIALSLFLFNLLPLPHADGSHMLRVLLAMWSPRVDTPSISQQPLQATLSSPMRPPQSRINTPTIEEFKEFEDSDDEDEYGDEEEGKRKDKEEKWKMRLRKGIEAGTVAMVVGWISGWAMLALLRSS